VRSTLTTFVVTLVLIATGLILYSTLGIVRNSDDPAAGTAANAFRAALEQDDGARACSLLAPETRSALEDERKKPCQEAIVEVKEDVEPQAAAASVNVAERSAFVETQKQDVVFLGRFGKRWLVSSSGCTRQAGDAPYSCELKG
jgi:hypothetical protein